MFYDTFIDLCAKSGKRPSDVSRELGIGKSTISMWRKQNSIPNAITLMQLAEYFNVTPAYLAGNKLANGPLHPQNENEQKEKPAQKAQAKPRLRSVARLEESSITPEQDEEISHYIDFLLNKKKDDR